MKPNRREAPIRLSIFWLMLVWLFVLSRPVGAAAPVPDKAISIAVETALYVDNYVPAYAIDVDTAEGVVTLSGTVDNLLAKDRALRIAESIRGVRAVIDRMTVVPVTRSDVEIKADVEQALQDDPAVSRYDVRAAVANGVVTLTGQVGSYAELQLAPALVKGVRGVRAVVNQIQFSFADVGSRSDVAIAADVRDRLARDIWVYDKLIHVAVSNSVVHLAGDVPSAIEKRRAAEDARVAGVRDVDHSQLNVITWLGPLGERKHRQVAKPDAALARDVSAAFLYDPRVNVTNVEVNVQDGSVTLRGVVNNLAAKRAAEADARDTVGIWEVHNLLKVRPATVPPDDALKKRIEAAFHRDPYLEVAPVAVRVRHGIVTLSGMVDTIAERSEAAAVASRIQGVVDVRDFMLAMPATEEELLNPPDIQYNLPPPFLAFPSTNRDQQLEKAVQDQLAWSPFVDADQVHVAASGRVVTLTGTVDSWMEYGAAEGSAYKAGATKVLNQLKVRHP